MTLNKIRTIHHLSCSGGTVICKALSCMENVFVMSEVNPNNYRNLKFNPFDPIQQLFARTELIEDESLRNEIFRQRIEFCLEYLQKTGRIPVLRDHTHTDFLGIGLDELKIKTSLLDALEGSFETVSVLTVRHPVDTYLSIEKNGWLGPIKSFDEFCLRMIFLIKSYSNVVCFKYEDFCKKPEDTVYQICNNLELQFSEKFLIEFHKIKLTGDSGRRRESNEIKTLPRREFETDFINEVKASKNFNKLCNMLGYELYE